MPIEYLKAAIKQLKDGESVWFGNDVLKKWIARLVTQILVMNDELFDVDTYMTRAERLASGEGEVSHAMTQLVSQTKAKSVSGKLIMSSQAVGLLQQ